MSIGNLLVVILSDMYIMAMVPLIDELYHKDN
jgi:hypothetical protein